MDTPRQSTGVPRLLWIAIGALLLQRAIYHLAYVVIDPFSRVTLSDGQLYEEAARDILAHAPLGSQPLYLQGLYAYLLALGMLPRGQVLDALLLQLVLAAGAIWLFARAAKRRMGAPAGAWSTLLLLACAALPFYENKFLSASLGVFCNVCALAAFVAFSERPTRRAALLLGAASGLAMLARPNMLFALPFTALGLWLTARAKQRPAPALLLQLALGVALALAPMAARNLLVTGRPNVFASHGGGIPFYIGNGPRSTGLWNDAGGLLSGQVSREQTELAAKLGLHASGDALDDAVGRELYTRAFAFMREQPAAWLAIEGKKLWYTLGNQELVHDYDLLGERELLGAAVPVGLPFGIVLGLGVLGLAWMARREPTDDDAEHGVRLAVSVMLSGQLVAVLLANLVWFTAAQHRMPLIVPLTFAAGPLLDALAGRLRGRPLPRLPLTAAVLAGILAAQAFLPRAAATRPSSVHYYNLGNAAELLGRYPEALEHYAHAVARNPKQPMFLLRYARLARATHHDREARAALDQLLALPALPAELRAAALTQARGLPER